MLISYIKVHGLIFKSKDNKGIYNFDGEVCTYHVFLSSFDCIQCVHSLPTRVDVLPGIISLIVPRDLPESTWDYDGFPAGGINAEVRTLVIRHADVIKMLELNSTQ